MDRWSIAIARWRSSRHRRRRWPWPRSSRPSRHRPSRRTCRSAAPRVRACARGPSPRPRAATRRRHRPPSRRDRAGTTDRGCSPRRRPRHRARGSSARCRSGPTTPSARRSSLVLPGRRPLGSVSVIVRCARLGARAVSVQFVARRRSSSSATSSSSGSSTSPTSASTRVAARSSSATRCLLHRRTAVVGIADERLHGRLVRPRPSSSPRITANAAPLASAFLHLRLEAADPGRRSPQWSTTSSPTVRRPSATFIARRDAGSPWWTR